MAKGQDELFPASLALPKDGHRNKWLCTETVLCSASLVSHRGAVPAAAHVGFVTQPLPALGILCASSHGHPSSDSNASEPRNRCGLLPLHVQMVQFVGKGQRGRFRKDQPKKFVSQNGGCKMPNTSNPTERQRHSSCKTLDAAKTPIFWQSSSAELSAVLGSWAGIVCRLWGHCGRGWMVLCSGQ